MTTATSERSTEAGSDVPSVRSAEYRRERLRRMRWRATLLLVAVTLVFLAVTIWGGDSTLAGYVQATSEAGMIGGLADWFAVVALFRHPLNIPIPHTAIIVERKDQFGATLGEFIQETFLTPEAVAERVRAADIVPRASDWLCDPDNASRLSAEVLDGAVKVADLLRDEDVRDALESAARERLDAVPVAPLAGRGLDFLIRDGRHQEALDAGLRELDRYLEQQGPELRDRLGTTSPWWLPGAAEDRIFERLMAGARTVLSEMLEDREHHLRTRFQERLEQLADDLQHSDEYRQRGEALKQEVLNQPEVRDWIGSLWGDVKNTVREQASDPDAEMRRRLADMVVVAGQRLREDPELAELVEDTVVQAVSYVVERFHGEIVELVSGTIERWDASETADRLELLLGPDLQFIRINGTVVGAGAGLALHALSRTLG